MTTSQARETLISQRLSQLSLEEKVRLLTGKTSWRLHPLPGAGLRELVMSDGPAGVRGVTDTDDETGASFPSPTALAATWDEDLLHRMGDLFAYEAYRHGVDVILAPVVNLQRTPAGGRHFEFFSEDPLLSGRLAATLVSSIQAHGIGTCVKHFVGNESETARTEYVARMDPRTLREVYLAPFETVVRDAGAWTIMAAYNGIDDGEEANSATEHHRLLKGILKGEWGFDGVVVSDWTAATSTAESANAGLDLVMPGPGGPWEDALLKAVRAGHVSEEIIDDKARRILRLAWRRGALDGVAPPRHGKAPAHPSGLLREAAARSTVVIKDETRCLPVNSTDLQTVALIGPNAVDTFLQGGGSCFVRPDHVVTPEAGLRNALGQNVNLTVHRGGYSRPHLPKLDLALTHQPDSDDAGLCVDYLDPGGNRLARWRSTDFNGWIRHDVPDAAVTARLHTRVRLDAPGQHRIGVGLVGRHRVWIDGDEVSRADTEADGGDVVLNSSVNDPLSTDHPVEITQPRHVEVIAELQVLRAYGWGNFVRAALRHRLPGPSDDAEIAAAADAAAAADLAVVVVGTNSEVESEGFDRANLALPGRQDELVAEVLSANPDAVIVVNAGAPVLLPWLPQARCVLWSWFPGQECGDALADVLLGRTEPSGRLPWTLPADAGSVPVPHAIPVDGVVDYDEGIDIGYRGHLRTGTTVAAPFGHGLGWTAWEYRDAEVRTDTDGGARVRVRLANTGPRAGHEVVQVYLSATTDEPRRPLRWLAGFSVTEVTAGDETEVDVHIARRAFAVWDVDTHDWCVPQGEYELHIGRSLSDIRITARVRM